MKRSLPQPPSATADLNSPTHTQQSATTGQSTVKKNVTKVEKYEVLEPPHQEPAKTNLIPARETEPDTDEIEIDPIEELLSQVDDEQNAGYVLRVDRLPEYRRTGLWGRQAVVEFVGEIEANLAYLSTIQNMFGPGDYRVILQDENRRFIKRWKVNIGAPLQPVIHQAARGVMPSQPPILPQQPEQRDTLADFISTLEKANQLKKLLGWDTPPQPDMLEAVNKIIAERMPQAEEKPLSDKLIELVAMKLLERNDETGIDRAVELLTGKRESGWLDTITDIAKPLIQQLAPAIGGALMASAARQQPATLPAQAQLPPAPIQPPAPPQKMSLIEQQGTGQQTLIPFGSYVPDGWFIAVLEYEQQQPATGFAGPSDGQASAQEANHSQPFQYPNGFIETGRTFSTSPAIQPHETESEDSEPHMDLIDSLTDMLEDCIREAAAKPEVVEKGYQEVQDFMRRNPMLSQFVLAIAGNDPQVVIGMLIGVNPAAAVFLNNTIAVEAIRMLQEKLKGKPS